MSESEINQHNAAYTLEDHDSNSSNEARIDSEIEAVFVREGVKRQLTLPSKLHPDSALASIATEYVAHPQRASLFLLSGAGLPELFPTCFANNQVWYICLPAENVHLVDEVLDVHRLYIHLSYTDSPWRHDAFVVISSETARKHAGQKRNELNLEVETRLVWNSLGHASADGLVLLVVQCNDLIRITARAVDKETLDDIPELFTRTYAKPWRLYSHESLAERTRAIEETGQDPGISAEERAVRLDVRVHTNFTTEHDTYVDSPSCGDAALSDRKISYIAGPQAAIGELKSLFHCRREGMLVDSNESFRIVVSPNIFDGFDTLEGEAWVERVELQDTPNVCTYVVQLRGGNSLVLVAMLCDDSRLSAAFERWSVNGFCPLALENQQDGRLKRYQFKWPGDFSAGTEAEQCIAPIEAPGYWVCDDSAVVNIVERWAYNVEGPCRCFLSGAHDVQGWQKEERRA